MEWAEWQEHYALIEEEFQYVPQKGRKWILSLEERHSFAHDAVFHVYSEKGEYMLQFFEVVDVLNLDLKEENVKLSETLSGNLRILLTTLRAEPPGELKQDSNARDGSRFKLSLAKKDTPVIYEWDSPEGDFKRIKPVLKLIWAVASWRAGAKAMGWSNKELNTRKTKLGGKGNESGDKEGGQGKKGKKGRLDPFGSMWYS